MMPHNRATRFANRALIKVDAFIADRPEYTRQDVEQPAQGSTNCGVYARRGENLVVFKVFCEEARKARESFAFRHWGKTGLIPELIWDADPEMLVMSYVPGTYLHQARRLDGEATWPQACRATGRAIATLTRVPMGSACRADFERRFYGELGALEAYLGRILDLGRSINALDPDFRDSFWRENLDFIEARLAGIFSQPRVLYHQDVGNLHVQHGRFMGFFDLEMCRVGCTAMQMASSLGMFVEEPGAWELFCEGWTSETGTSLGPEERAAVVAASYLLGWREISRYLSYDATSGTGYSWASSADPVRYRKFAKKVTRMLDIEAR